MAFPAIHSAVRSTATDRSASIHDDPDREVEFLMKDLKQKRIVTTHFLGKTVHGNSSGPACD